LRVVRYRGYGLTDLALAVSAEVVPETGVEARPLLHTGHGLLQRLAGNHFLIPVDQSRRDVGLGRVGVASGRDGCGVDEWVNSEGLIRERISRHDGRSGPREWH